MASSLNRREFVTAALAFAAAAKAADPSVKFPSDPRKRLSVATYPFRSFIISPKKQKRKNSDAQKSEATMTLAQFAGTVKERFNVSGIEPWGRHFESLEPDYLNNLASAFDKAQLHVVNIPCDANVDLCGDKDAQATAIKTYQQWVEAAIILKSPSIRVHLSRPHASASAGKVDCALDGLKALAEYGAQKNIVVNLENDSPDSEDPYRILKVIEAAKTPYLRSLPDFCNSRLLGDENYNLKALEALFPHALNISHVKDVEMSDGKPFTVDMNKVFAIAKKSGYRGYFSMEFEGAGDPYEGTKLLLEASLKNLS
jgi:sugar phosphate isomerase/epimerase